LNLNKTRYLEFQTKHHSNVKAEIRFDLKLITKATETKFLGLIIDHTLSWKQHIDQVINKICIKSLESKDTLRIIYFVQVHSIKLRYYFWV
jgi:hypothetical protein